MSVHSVIAPVPMDLSVEPWGPRIWWAHQHLHRQGSWLLAQRCCTGRLPWLYGGVRESGDVRTWECSSQGKCRLVLWVTMRASGMSVMIQINFRSTERHAHTARLSHDPWAIFESVFAEHGATRTMSAQRRSSMWSIGSPILNVPWAKWGSNPLPLGYCKNRSHCPLILVSPNPGSCLLHVLLIIKSQGWFCCYYLNKYVPVLNNL